MEFIPGFKSLAIFIDSRVKGSEVLLEKIKEQIPENACEH